MKKKSHSQPPTSAATQPGPGPQTKSVLYGLDLEEAYQSADLIIQIARDMALQALRDWQQVCRGTLYPGRDLFLLDVEAKIRRRAALHLRDMLLFLHDMLQSPAPLVRIERAEQVQVAIIHRGSAKKSAKI